MASWIWASAYSQTGARLRARRPTRRSAGRRAAVRRSAKERANGMESHWALFKRGFAGAHHRMSVKRLWRYANEFAGRHNLRPPDGIDRMGLMAANPDRKRLKCKDLIGPKWTRQPSMLRCCV